MIPTWLILPPTTVYDGGRQKPVNCQSGQFFVNAPYTHHLTLVITRSLALRTFAPFKSGMDKITLHVWKLGTDASSKLLYETAALVTIFNNDLADFLEKDYLLTPKAAHKHKGL